MAQRIIPMNATTAFEVISARESTARPLHKPQRKPERLPQAPAHRQENAVRAKPAISLVAVFGTAVAIVLLFFVIFNYVKLYEAQNEVSDLRQTRQTLHEEQQRLQLQYEEAIDLNAITERATALGLHEPLPSQIVYVTVQTQDSAQVYAAPAERGFFARVYDAFVGTFRDVAEYFS